MSTLRDALAELVALKDLHDKCENWPSDADDDEDGTAMWQEYRRRKPLAWAAARAALAQSDAQPVAWCWRRRGTDARGVYMVDPSKYLDMDNPAYEWVRLYASPQEAQTEPTPAQTESACLSFRHDYGLLNNEQRANVRYTAREWWRAWQKEGARLSAAQPTRERLTPQQIADIVEAAWNEAEAETVARDEAPETEWTRYGEKVARATEHIVRGEGAV